ncbi:MAG: phytanoyl-CoA dioxygenase [Paenibacillus sp.]|nr:phytanoyl-CoA dioxygenase [Paenibacillus sp.]
MVDTRYLLNDEQIAQFITNGFLQLQTDFSEDFHKTVFQKITERYATEGNPGNNLVARIPEIQLFFDHPTVKGALTSILGPDYVMHAHRHGHLNTGKNKAEQAGEKFVSPSIHSGGWHKDSYWGNARTRSHYPWSVMIFYYPHEVTEEMGATGIMPGSQNRYNVLEALDDELNFPVVGKAGTFALVDYDMWHRATANVSTIDRFMLKFIFFRLESPTQPTWNNERAEWQPPQQLLPVSSHPLVWENVWNWMSGSIGKHGPVDANADIAELEQKLYGSDESAALNAAMELAALGEKGIPALAKGLRHPEPGIEMYKSFSVARLCAKALASAGKKALPALMEALDAEYDNREVLGFIAFAIGELREQASEAAPKLIALLQEESEFIRHHVVEALGLIKQPTETIVPVLSELMNDPDQYVRFLAGLALARIGGDAAQAAVPALVQTLYDRTEPLNVPYLTQSNLKKDWDNDKGARYASAIAAYALERIGTKEAIREVLHFLQTARWCPVTHSKSGF